jgi:alpha-L-rhamnosidase
VKKNAILIPAVIIALFFWSCSSNKQSELTFTRLLVEYAENPINIDVKKPRFSWVISSSGRNKHQYAYRILVSTDRKLLDNNTGDFWDSGKVYSNETIQHELENVYLKSNHKYFWKVIVWDEDDRDYESPVAKFETALLDPKDWIADWIGGGNASEPLPEKGFFGHRREQEEMSDSVIHSGRSLLLRNAFHISKKVKSAKAYITGLGFYEFYINDKRVGDHVLAPAKTPYHKHILYDTYDVTGQFNNGENILAIHLGNGWYNPYKEWWQEYRMQWFGHKKAIGQVHLTYTDGSLEIIKTDESWLWSDGPLTFNCIYDGEVFNANLEQTGWTAGGFDDSDWKAVTVFNLMTSKLKSHTMPAIKVIESIKPEELQVEESNMRVFDMGQNFAGWVRIKATGNKGSKIIMRFAEDINEDGTIDVTSNERAKAQAEYIFKGKGVEIYEPAFTYFGFKYVEVTTEGGHVDLIDIEGRVVHTDNKLIGSFHCDNSLVNKLHQATVWSQRSNMLGYPMDCPQRDERLGWFGDAQVTAEEAMFNFDMALFYENWFKGIKDNQDEATGDIPIISPRPYFQDEGIEWSSTYIIMLWQYYIYYGDQRILKEHYGTMKRYMVFLDSISSDYILPAGWIGDWGSMVEGWRGGKPESVPTAFYFFNARVLSKVAGVLGNISDQQYFSKLATEIRTAYNNQFFNAETGNYDDGSQMANAFPLFLDIVPDGFRGEVLGNLIKDIVVNHDNHLTTGVLGTKYMPEALAQYGRADVAWDIINQKTYPSWNIMMDKYTTTCEFWTLKQSKNHVMMGSIDAWFYKYISGIHIDERDPAYSSFVIKPLFLKGLKQADGSIETIKGKLRSKWTGESGKFSLEVEVPFNTSAVVHIPGNKEAEIYESGNRLEDVGYPEYLKYSHGAHQVRINSGKYRFTIEHD